MQRSTCPARTSTAVSVSQFIRSCLVLSGASRVLTIDWLELQATRRPRSRPRRAAFPRTAPAGTTASSKTPPTSTSTTLPTTAPWAAAAAARPAWGLTGTSPARARRRLSVRVRAPAVGVSRQAYTQLFSHESEPLALTVEGASLSLSPDGVDEMHVQQHRGRDLLAVLRGRVRVRLPGAEAPRSRVRIQSQSQSPLRVV